MKSTLRRSFLAMGALVFLLVLLGLWQRGPRPAGTGRGIPTALRAGISAARETDAIAKPALAPAPGAATLAPRLVPLRRDQNTGTSDPGDWATERAAFVPPSPQPDPTVDLGRQILLASGPLTPPPGMRASVARGEPTPRGLRPYIVQADSAEQLAARKAELEAVGGLVHGYLPNNAWLVEFDDAAKARAEALPFVRATVAYDPALRLQPWLAQAAGRFDPARTVLLAVQTFLPGDAPPVADRLRAVGAAVSSVVDSPGRRSGRVTAEVPLALVEPLASWSGVQWVEEYLPPRLLNDQATRSDHANTAPLRLPWGLDGSGQTVGHADTGLDTGDTATLHPDVRGRVTGSAWGRVGDWSDTDGHGTHTAGSIVGDGTASGGQFAGAAPGASLFHQSVEDASGYLNGLYDLYALYEETYDAGARIHSDSWGSDTVGAYNVDSQDTDEFAWDHPEFLAIFAAGNAGIDANSNGVVDPGSIGAPATAKNVLSVGATENDRASGSSPLSAYSYYAAWGSDYPANPIRNDLITWSYTPGPPYLQGMAAFSSRGPAADGRVKPEVTAPGCDVLSLKSSLAASSWLDYATNPSNYTYNVGTSMATPLVAGTAALLRQGLARIGHPAPTAALLRAMLAGGARSLSPGQYGTGTTREIPATVPNSVEGHGQVDLAGTLYPEGGLMARVLDRVAVSEATPTEIPVTVTVAGAGLRVVLAWSDPPATAGAGVTLANNLDLALVTPSGTVLKPATIGGGGTDTLNNLERIDVAAAVSGVYTVRVSVASLPYPDPDRFVAALYLRGAMDEPPVLFHDPGEGSVPVSEDPLSVAVSAHYHRSFTNGEVAVRYTYGTEATPSLPWTGWASHALAETGTIPGGWTLAADLVRPSAAEYLHYVFVVDTGSQTVVYPETGAYTVQGYEGIPWTVTGYPGEYGTVDPGYGEHFAIPGQPITATAPAFVETGTGQRVRCLAFFGEGGIPFGLGASATFTLSTQPEGSIAPRLTWLWQAQNALTQASAPQGAVDQMDWFDAGTAGTTAVAPEIAWDGLGNPFALYGWWVEGARWPGSSGASPNPATGIVMSAPKAAEARYMDFWLDEGGNGLRDAWELRWTGSADAGLGAGDDPDGDNWTNLGEDLDNTNPNSAASYPTPAVIADVTVFANPVTSAPPYTVEAMVTDNFVVVAVDLLWRNLGESAWNTVSMDGAGTNRFTATFTPPYFGTVTSEYCVVAADLIGWNFPEFATTSTIHRVWSELPTPRVAFDPAGPWTLEGSSLSIVTQDVTLANYGSVPLDYSLHLLGVAQRYEQETSAQRDLWSKYSNSGTYLWRNVGRRATQGTNSWYCGSSSNLYGNSVYAYLDAPAFLVASNSVLAYDQWIKTEYDSGEYFWDGGLVSYSVDGGATWGLLEPIGGYPHKITPNPGSPFPDDQPCFGGLGEGWSTVYFDLTAFAGQTLHVSFEFGSDGATVDEGWYVDNVRCLSPDAGVQAILLSGATQGSLSFRQAAPFRMRFHPSLLPPGTQQEEAILLATHNDPYGTPLHGVTARFGYRVDATAGGPGSLSFASALLFQGQSTTLVATADAYAEIEAVTTNGAAWATMPHATARTLGFSNLTANVDVGVTFDWTVLDEGVPLWWMGQYGLEDDAGAGLYGDPDGDGQLTWQEYVANTSPTNALSCLRIHTLEPDGAGWRIAWSGGPDRTAVVDRATSPSPSTAWHEETVLQPQSATEYEQALTNAPASFFRIRPLPPSGYAPPEGP